MEQRHEVIDFPSNSPVKVFIHKIGDVNTHWHQSIELLYIARGNVDIILGGELLQLTETDLLLIGPNIPHSLRSENATMIALQIKMERLTAIPQDLQQNGHFLNLQDAYSKEHPEGFSAIKQCIAQLLKMNVEGGMYLNLINASYCYRLIHVLLNNYYVETGKKRYYGDGQLERIQNLLNYINTHFQDTLSLEKLAELVALTPAHLSKTFKRYMGVTLSEYIKSVRIHRAVSYLSSTTLSIDEVTEKCGFPNKHSFIDAFRAKYNETPSQWRKLHKSGTAMVSDVRDEKSIGYFSSDSSILYSSISDFIEKYSGNSAEPQNSLIPDPEPEYLMIDMARPVIRLHHSERAIIGISRAEELLYEPVQRMLMEAQKQIGFRYVKMHSILDDSMMVYSEYGGIPHYNFLLVDRVFDFLKSIGLKPYVQLSFMPKDMAKLPNKTTFFAHAITSPPEDPRKWNQLISRFVTHLIERYGMEEVLTWPFGVWNEPFTASNFFGFDQQQEYYNLYSDSYSTIKKIDQRFQVGGPSHLSAHNKGDDSLYDFLEWTRRNNCIPDFLDVHYYDTDFSQVFLNEDGIKVSSRLSSSVTSFSDYSERIHRELAEHGFGEIPIYLTEWNSTTSHRDLLSDTCFKSSYIIKNIMETMDRFQAIGYWLLTDLHKESQLNDKLFHGGLGMYSVNGIQKPAYHAFRLLSMLGEDLIEKGDGYCVTRSGSKIVIVLNNYHHFSNAYANEVGINCTYTSRYCVFPDQKSKRIVLVLPELQGVFSVTHYILNRSHGSAFDTFLQMGAVEPLSEMEVEFLKAQSMPFIVKEVHHGELTLDLMLEPFETRCVVIEPKRQPE